jgi:hypothetical protein
VSATPLSGGRRFLSGVDEAQLSLRHYLLLESVRLYQCYFFFFSIKATAGYVYSFKIIAFEAYSSFFND